MDMIQQEEWNELSDIDKMIYCIQTSAICVKDTPDVRWLIETLLKDANAIKNGKWKS